MKSFKEALDLDLRRAGLDRKALADALHISVQAVGKWVTAAAVPAGRRGEVAKLLGPDALVLVGAFEAPSERVALQETPGLLNSSMLAGEAQNKKLLLAAALGPKHAMHVDKLVRFGASSRRFDYLSPRLCVETVRVRDFRARPSDRPGWASVPISARLAVLSLALLNEVLPSSSDDEFERAIALIVDGLPLSPSELARFTAEAALLGVSVIQVPSMKDVAEYIVSMEKSVRPLISGTADNLALASESEEDWQGPT